MTQNEKGPGWQPGSPQDNSAPLDKQNPESTQAEIVLHNQAETEVYFDENGCLVIGQMDEYGDPAHAVFITPENVQTFARAIARIAGLTEGDTSAERARRYRKKKRDASQEERDGVRDASRDGRDANVTLFPHVVKVSS
jgi:hypothetical protein